MAENKLAQIVPKRLIECTPFPTENWHAFLVAWNRAVEENDICALMGRLHEGFTVRTNGRYSEPEYGRDDVLLFYISVANGWCNPELLKVDTDRRLDLDVVYVYDDRGQQQKRSRSQMRQVVAQKAMDMLTQNFFKVGGEKGERMEEWQSRIDHIISSERLFRAFATFFTADETFRVPNLTPQPYSSEKDRNLEIAKSFLLDFAEAIFYWREREIWKGMDEKSREEIASRNAATKKMLDEAKPWALEVLNQFRKLHDIRNFVSEADVTKIREMALRIELNPDLHPVSKYRLVTTVEEAYVAGSHAGWFLVGYEARQKELARLQSVLDSDSAYQKTSRQEAVRKETIRQLEAAKEATDQQLRELRSARK